MIQPDEVDLTGLSPTPTKPKTTIPGATDATATTVSQPFSIGKAQGGTSPAMTPTDTSSPAIQPMTAQTMTPDTSSATIPTPTPTAPSPFPDPPDVRDNPFLKPQVSDVPPIDPTTIQPPVATETGFMGSNEPAVPVPQIPTAFPTGTSPIDPANDLRGQTILPGEDPALDQALKGTQNATTALDTFDRRGLVQSLMGQDGGPDIPDIAPGDDLRNTVISDDDDARTTGYAGAVDSAANRLPTDIVGRSNALRDDYLGKLGNTDVEAGADPSLAASDRLNKYGTMLDESVNGLNSVDRVKMAQDLYKIFQDQEAPNRAARERKAMQVAAATGGLRSGRLRTSIGDLELANKREDNLTERQLIAQALSDSIQDQYNKADFLRGTESNLAGREAGLRDEQRSDRNYRTDVATGNVNRRTGNVAAATTAGSNLAADEADNAYRGLDALRSLESGARDANRVKIAGKRTERANQLDLTDRKRSIFESNRTNANNQADAASDDIARRVDANRALFGDVNTMGQNRRNEARGERDYQGSLEDQAFQRRLAQYEAEQKAQQQQFQNGLASLGAGESGNPSDVLAQLAEEGGIDPQLIAALAQSMGSKPSSGGGGGLDLGGLTDLLKLLPKKTGVDTPTYNGTLPA